jgi:hypothetical protein
MGLPQFGHDQQTSASYRYQSSAMGATVYKFACAFCYARSAQAQFGFINKVYVL